jgi:uncharacterized LabA/DUF88 family protein
MVFVDGTNFLCRLEDCINRLRKPEKEIKIKADKMEANALNFANTLIGSHTPSGRSYNLIRRYWFSSYKGSGQDRIEIANRLRQNQFEPVLFRKRGNREKGVDIALTMSMLTNAFNQNYDIGVLFAGDEDYVELVKEAKRYGPQIYGCFFDLEFGLSEELMLTFDHFTIIRPTKIPDNLKEPS